MRNWDNATGINGTASSSCCRYPMRRNSIFLEKYINGMIIIYHIKRVTRNIAIRKAVYDNIQNMISNLRSYCKYLTVIFRNNNFSLRANGAT